MPIQFGEPSGLSEADSFRVLEELELNKPADVAEVRAKFAFNVKAEVIARPANLGDRDSLQVLGMTRELQKSSVRALFARPVTVGNVFHLTFDREALDLPPAFAMCQRCVMLDDDAFDVSLAFFSSIKIPE